MEQTKALNALEPWLALSKSATSPTAAANLVMQAIAAPNTYVFAELLQTPNVQKLRDSEQEGHLKLLEIFAWGTYKDYVDNKSTLPPLTAPQETKLKLLSLIPLASSHDTLTYTSIQSLLSLPSTTAIESLITEAFYADLLIGTLDPLNSRVNITAVSPLRDLAPGSLPGLQSSLTAWSGRCEDALKDLEAQAEAVRVRARERTERRVLREGQVKAAVEREEAKGNGKGKGVGGEDAMDVDEEDGENNGGGMGRRSQGKRGLGIGGGRRLG